MTPTTTTLPTESARQGDFYVPRFKVTIDGANLPRDPLLDIRSVTYHDDVKNLDSFTLTVNNWDAATRTYKYIGSETTAQLSDGHPDRPRLTLFEPCGKEVVLQMGYGNTFTTMLRGTFTSIAPSFDDGGAELVISGLNVLNTLRTTQHTTTFVGKKDSEIAQDIARRTDQGRPRFPLPIHIDPDALHNQERPIPFVLQDNMYDIDFLFQRARQRGYVIFVQNGELYFGPSQREMIPGLRDVRFELAWGRSLMSFKPSIETAQQVRRVTVRGWNRTQRQRIARRVELSDQRITVNRDLHRLLTSCEGRDETVVDEPVFANDEASERAIAVLQDQLRKLVTADVQVVGLPDLRAGQIVVIKGVGARLSGNYFVTETTHTIDDHGYLTSFKCHREEPLDGSR